MFLLTKLAQWLWGPYDPERRQSLSFEKQDGNWYIVLPHWPGSHDDLQMVRGIDRLLDYYADGKCHVTLWVTTKMEDFSEGDLLLWAWEKPDDGDGMTYFLPENHPSGLEEIWLGPITSFVFNKFPRVIIPFNIKSF